MIEKKALTFEELLSTAKTLKQIQCSPGYYQCKQTCARTEEECRKEFGEWVSLGLVQRTFFAERTFIKKQLKEKIQECIILLTEVSEKRGAYSQDHLQHAENVIENASERAKRTIEILKELSVFGEAFSKGQKGSLREVLGSGKGEDKK